MTDRGGLRRVGFPDIRPGVICACLLLTLALVMASPQQPVLAKPLAATVLTVRVSALPVGVRPRVSLMSARGHALVLADGRTVSRPAGKYRIVARPVSKGPDTYYPVVAPCAVVARCAPLSGGRFRLASRAHLTIYVVYADVVRRTTRVLSAGELSKLASFAPTSGALTFDDAMPTGVHIGSILVAGPARLLPRGLLARVVGLRKRGRQTVIATVPATLAEAMPRGELYARHSAAHIADTPSTNLQWSLGDTPFSCGPSTGLMLTPTASVTEPAFTFTASWGWLGGPTVSMEASTTATASLDASEQAGLSCSVSKELPDSPDPGYVLPAIVVPIGPVPVVLDPELVLGLGATVGLTGSIEVGATANASFSAGVKYEEGKLTPTSSLTTSFTPHVPVLEGSGEISAGLGPKLYFDLYGTRYIACVLGDCEDAPAPYLQLTFGPGVKLQPKGEPWWELAGLVTLGAGLNIPDLGLDVSEEFPLYRTRLLAPPGAPVAVTATAGDGTATVGWLPPTPDTCGCVPPITGYDVYVNSRLVYTAGATASGASLTSLVNGTTYTIEVAAVASSLGVAGQGTRSTAVQVTPTGPVQSPTQIESAIAPAEELSLPPGFGDYFYVGSTAGGKPMEAITWSEDLGVIASYLGNEAISIGRSASDTGSYVSASGNHAIAGAAVNGYTISGVYSNHVTATGAGAPGGTELDLSFDVHPGETALILVGGEGTGTLELSGIAATTLQNQTYSEAGSNVIASAAIYTAQLPAGEYTAHWHSTTYPTNSGTSLGAVAYDLAPD